MSTPRGRLNQPRLRRIAAAILAVAAVIGLTLLGRQQWTPQSPADNASPGQSPVECVTAMVEAQQAGDVSAYLDRFTGPLRTQLQERFTSMGAEKQQKRLRRQVAGLTGHATTDVQIPGDGSASLVLERIFRHHNERLQVRLQRRGQHWKIVELELLERFTPEIPYGTPISVPSPEEETGQAEKSPETENPGKQ